MIKFLLLVGLGSGIGGMFRVAISLLINLKYGKTVAFPIGILMVNLIGCFLMGLAFAYLNQKPRFESLYVFLAMGFLGGFTTFSAFSLEALQLFQSRDFSNAFIYISLSTILSVIACYLGISLKNLWQ